MYNRIIFKGYQKSIEGRHYCIKLIQVKTLIAVNRKLSFEFPNSQGEKGKMEIWYLTKVMVYYLTKGSVDS